MVRGSTPAFALPHRPLPLAVLSPPASRVSSTRAVREYRETIPTVLYDARAARLSAPPRTATAAETVARVTMRRRYHRYLPDDQPVNWYKAHTAVEYATPEARRWQIFERGGANESQPTWTTWVSARERRATMPRKNGSGPPRDPFIPARQLKSEPMTPDLTRGAAEFEPIMPARVLMLIARGKGALGR